ncbi:MAG: hypothetical protein VYA69_14435, partial [Gemmatimonadota bacterium]|nr:hypothetical protein [Gemmatimonadota bacterium]
MKPLLNSMATQPQIRPDPEILSQLQKAGFREPNSAGMMLYEIGQHASDLASDRKPLPSLLEAIVDSFDPNRALNNIYTLLMQENETIAASLLRLFARHPDETNALVGICASSQPLSMAIIQDPEHVLSLFSDARWKSFSSVEVLFKRLSAMIDGTATFEGGLIALRTFKRQEYLHIAMCDLMKLADTSDILRRLSDVADVCLQGACDLSVRELVDRHGEPLLPDGQPSRFAVIGMGKLGGQELNFSSDIDILYVYDSPKGKTSRSGLSTYEYYTKLARMVTDAIGRITPEGIVFRVDLRLRPDGRTGDIASAVDGYRRHYYTRGQIWERQALIKARPVAGSHAVGQQLLDAIEPFVFHPESDPLILEDINRSREKIAHTLLEKGSGEHHVKLGPGGIREIEFITQGFQLIHTGAGCWPWERSTLPALSWIASQGYLADHEVACLHDAYLFLRDLEN